MGYVKRLDRAFENAPILPWTNNTRYVFFSDCHRGIGNNNDNFLPNANNYFAALQYYYQYGFCYIEAGDGDELWENRRLCQIMEVHSDIFNQLCRFHRDSRLYMLYGNHDIVKRKIPPVFEDMGIYEGIILESLDLPHNLCITHGHQADLLNSVFWRLARFLVRYLWAPLERLGFLNPGSDIISDSKKGKLEQKYIRYAKDSDCLLLTGHTHKTAFGNDTSPYYNCGSCVHPKFITCIELCGYEISLVKWYASCEKSEHFGNIYSQCPPVYPIYIKREVLESSNLL